MERHRNDFVRNLGYATEFPLQQRFRGVMAYLGADGTAELKKRVIGNDILARRSTSF
jgi:cyclohexanecarboxyl-CoA dehydrogenase